MISTHVSVYVKLPLQITVILMAAISISHTKQCKPTTPERDSSIIIRNVGIKFCQLKCVENGHCLSVQYNIDTLTCRLLRVDSTEAKAREGFDSLSRNTSDVPTGSCSSKMCSFGQRCLKTRCGKTVCIQDEKENDPEKSPQGIGCQQEIFVNSPLHDACRKGNLTGVRRIMSQGLVDINSRDGNHGKTPLMVAAQEGHCRIFEFLIRKGANKSEVDYDGRNVLHWACKGGHMDMVECVLPEYGVPIKNRRMSPLMQAVIRGCRDVFEFLVCMGANVSQRCDGGDGVLHWACKGGHLDMVKYLLSQGSLDINSKGEGGKTPVMYAVMWKDTVICELLVSSGANLSQVDDNGDNVLHIASKEGELDAMKILLSQGSVDINSKGNYRRSPLMNAAYYGNKQVFDLLANKGGLHHGVDYQGHNILHLATMGKCQEIVKLILSHNMTDINARDNNGKTAAMIAKHAGAPHVYKLLVSRGCPVK